MAVTVTGFNHWGQIAAHVKPACQKAIDKTALAINADAAGAAPVRTGFMAESVYSVLTDGSSNYGVSGTAPPGDSYLLPEVRPDNDMEAIVGAAANYSIFVEMGHHTRGGGSWVPAQPFFTPAVETGRGVLDAELANVFTGITGSIV